jgi:hypothetical protein
MHNFQKQHKIKEREIEMGCAMNGEENKIK